jgi:ABC-type glycerol-3-phosphate transport system substrate-binding protein
VLKGKGKNFGILGVPGICCALVLLSFPYPVVAFRAEDVNASNDEVVVFQRYPTYRAYLEQHAGKDSGSDEINIDIQSFTYQEDVELVHNYDEQHPLALKTPEGSRVQYEIEVEKPGFYRIECEYLPLPGKGIAIERQLLIDDEVAFHEANRIVFERFYMDATNVRETTDANKNEMRPEQIEVSGWSWKSINDGAGYYTTPLKFYLTEGSHRITLVSIREPMMIGDIKISGYKDEISYKRYLEGHKDIRSGGSMLIDEVQAENPSMKSDPMLYPSFDRSSAYTKPQSADVIKLNTISGDRWKLPGQWLEWRVKVPEDGLYKINVRARQNTVSGFFSSRTLYVNGEVPFEEARNIRFAYSTDWKNVELGAGSGPFLIYLSSDQEQTIRLECTIGEMTKTIEQVDASLLTLNSLFRQILMLTGPNPDVFRDYEFELEIPEVLVGLKEQSEALKNVKNDLIEILGKEGERTAIFDTITRLLDDIVHRPREIASRFETLKNAISGLGTWVLVAREQPLQIDYVQIVQSEFSPQRAEPNFWEKLSHEFRLLVAAFFSDYNSMGSVDGRTGQISVWTTAPRDQTSILRQMLESSYNDSADIHVQMITPGTLLPSVLAGKGPDVSLNLTSADIMNLAARGALASLSQMKGLVDIEKDFMRSALIPLYYDGELYAIPETQTFPVMFYRKDILSDLMLPLPKTWDDVYNMLPVIQKKNMTFGMQPGLPSFAMFLYQNGGELYHPDQRTVALDTEISIQAFKMQTEFFLNYGIPFEYNFQNRFRIGEMPIGIADYTLYNLLSVFAPEIKGLWGIAPVPGTIKNDGTIDIHVASGVSGAAMMQGTEHEREAFEFMKWWVSTETQTRYGREQESILGSAARYNTANVNAMKSLPWTSSEMHVLEKQWDNTVGIPEVPGGYYTPRYIAFAFRKVVIANENPRETMLDYVDVINDEIAFKRLEFGLKD